MGSHHQTTDAFSAIPLPPTQLHSRPTTNTNTSLQATTTTNGHFTPLSEQPETSVVKKEAKTPKAKKDGEPPKVGKKRGQYKKTILRKQAEAEAAAATAAAAAAAAVGVPYVTPRPLSPIASTRLQPTKLHTTSLQRSGTAKHSSTIESLAVKSQRPRHETPTDRTSLEMEQELAMLAEEAEEDRIRREEEAADRILKRAQVVKHLRSLKSKLATAQIQIGHDLHYQSVDLFSQLYDEVLEDIGKDNSEMMELLKSAREQDGEPQSDQEESTHSHLGHMLTRSSDRPKKQDLIATLSSPAPFPSRSQFSDSHGSTSRRLEFEGGFDDNDVKLKRYRRGRSDGHFIGQSWDVGSGQENGAVGAKAMTLVKSRSKNHDADDLAKSKIYRLEDDDTDDGDDESHREIGMPTPKRQCALGPRTREELQLRQRRELEGLQSQQRKDQEEFQRKQLDQLRELQERHNEEFHKFEAAKAKVYQEHLDGLAEKRFKISQSQYHPTHQETPTRPKQKSAYSSSSLAYEFESGFDAYSSDTSSSPSRSPSPSPRHISQQPRQSHPSMRAFSSVMKQSHADRSTLSPVPVTSTPRASKTPSSVHQLPMSTMTMALAAMNEKKKQLKRANKKQNEHERAAESSENGGCSGTRLQSPPIWSQKRGTDEERVEVKRRASTVNTTSELLSATTTTTTNSRHIQPLTEQHIHSGLQQGFHRSIDQSSPFADQSDLPQTPMPKARGRKRKNTQATRVVPNDQDDSFQETPSKTPIDFNKELLSHFGDWKPDEKTEHFFDLVLSDPPETHVGEIDVEGLLSGGRRPSEGASGGQEANSTPTSNAFRWYQEQQRLADELAQQPKMTPMRLNGETGKGASITAVSTTTSVAGDQTHGGSPFAQGLVPGEDPLAAFIEPSKKSRQAQGTSSNDHNKHGRSTPTTNEGQQGVHVGGGSHGGQSHFIADSSPFLESSPMAMLFSENGADDWNFGAFTTNATDEYLNTDFLQK
ncbi:hypothetical protein BGZ47_002081 [Haplosporangium gracile]|nr:hypothetical protein BGZ47_002081 [Haplosporangium gracile]